jgi:hypothetical protein
MASDAPRCINCGQNTHMVIEHSTASQTVWFCRICLTKTTTPTWWGHIAPFLSVGLTLVIALFGGGLIDGGPVEPSSTNGGSSS